MVDQSALSPSDKSTNLVLLNVRKCRAWRLLFSWYTVLLHFTFSTAVTISSWFHGTYLNRNLVWRYIKVTAIWHQFKLLKINVILYCDATTSQKTNRSIFNYSLVWEIQKYLINHSNDQYLLYKMLWYLYLWPCMAIGHIRLHIYQYI